jgi:hypothetical protein
MWQGTNGTYNIVAVVFLALTLTTCFCTLLIMADVVGVPSSIAPVTDVPQPTLRLVPTLDTRPTLTPTPVVTAKPTLTPLPSN